MGLLRINVRVLLIWEAMSLKVKNYTTLLPLSINVLENKEQAVQWLLTLIYDLKSVNVDPF